MPKIRKIFKSGHSQVITITTDDLDWLKPHPSNIITVERGPHASLIIQRFPRRGRVRTQ
jgi:hypothetical protein